MTTRTRLPLMVLLWLLTTAGAGLFFAWLLWPVRPREPSIVYRDRTGPPPTAETPLPATRSPGGPPPVVLPDAGAPPAAASVGDTSPPPRPTASILVQVLCSDGAPPEDGTVYALGAGEEGDDDESRVFAARIDEPGPVLLRLPSPGLYDIGFSGEQGTTLLRDVLVAAGEGNEIVLPIAAGIPVQVRIEGAWPPPGAEDVRLTVNLWAEDGARVVEFPGRRDRGYAGGAAILEGATGASSPLETGRVYQVRAVVQESATWLSGPHGSKAPLVDSPRFTALPDRDTVRPGETVVVTIRSDAALLVRGIGSLPPAEGKKTRNQNMFVTVTREDVLLAAFYLPVLRARSSNAPAPFTVLNLQPGPCRLRWSGKGLLSGERAEVLRSGEVRPVDIEIQGDPLGDILPPPARPAETASVEEEYREEVPFPLVLEGIPAGSNGTFTLYGQVRDPGEGEEGMESWEEQFDTDEEEMELDEDWRGLREVAVVLPPFLASDFTAMPSSGPARMAMRPAGLLSVVPTEVWPEEFGTLRLRRADGRPLATAEDGGRSFCCSEYEVEFEQGMLLGPFPEGTLVFEVRLGGLRLPDAKAVVKAGRIEVLRVTR